MKGVDVEEVIKKRQFEEEMAFWKESEWTFIKILQNGIISLNYNLYNRISKQ